MTKKLDIHYLETGGRQDRRGFPSIEISARGAALIGFVLFALFGWLMPTWMLEAISYQLYLDTITEAARPPLGMTASIVATIFFASAGGLLFFGAALLLGVEMSKGNLAALITRVRGDVGEDEEDAPALRSADRHPDAPARRPFSAMRDIPARHWDEDGPSADLNDGDDIDEELLLDGHFVAPMADADATAEPEQAAAETSAPAAEPDEPVEPTSGAPVAAAPAVPPRVLSPMASQTQSFRPVPSPTAMPPIATPSARPAPAPIAERPATPAPEPRAPDRIAMPVPEPLDLSAAKLEDLLARLEAGLIRREAASSPMTAAPAEAAIPAPANNDFVESERVPTAPTLGEFRVSNDVGRAAPVAEAPAPRISMGRDARGGDAGDNPAFPHDPALAAALATLRRLNQKVG